MACGTGWGLTISWCGGNLDQWEGLSVGTGNARGEHGP